jgi:hypothetical protein
MDYVHYWEVRGRRQALLPRAPDTLGTPLSMQPSSHSIQQLIRTLRNDIFITVCNRIEIFARFIRAEYHFKIKCRMLPANVAVAKNLPR